MTEAFPPRRLQEAAEALGVAWAGDDAAFTAVSTDTRTLGAGALFVATNGNDANTGTIDKPIATLQSALDRAAEAAVTGQTAPSSGVGL